jgi:hypothetical protein
MRPANVPALISPPRSRLSRRARREEVSSTWGEAYMETASARREAQREPGEQADREYGIHIMDGV